jgi:ketosteroid isomerase-like protein
MSHLSQHAYSTITSDEEKQYIGNQFFDALKTQNWELMRSIITEDCTWTLPGDNLLSGAYFGSDEVIKKARQFAGYKISLALNHVLYSLSSVALVMHNQGIRDKLELDEHLATVCVLRDGKISAITTFFSDMAGMNAFYR